MLICNKGSRGESGRERESRRIVREHWMKRVNTRRQRWIRLNERCIEVKRGKEGNREEGKEGNFRWKKNVEENITQRGGSQGKIGNSVEIC